MLGVRRSVTGKSPSEPPRMRRTVNLQDLYRFYHEQMERCTGRIWKMLFSAGAAVVALHSFALQLAEQVLSPDEWTSSPTLAQVYIAMSLALPYAALFIVIGGYLFMRGEFGRRLRWLALATKVESLLRLAAPIPTRVFSKDMYFLDSDYYQSTVAEKGKSPYKRSGQFLKDEFSYWNINGEPDVGGSFRRVKQIILWGFAFLGLGIASVLGEIGLLLALGGGQTPWDFSTTLILMTVVVLVGLLLAGVALHADELLYEKIG